MAKTQNMPKDVELKTLADIRNAATNIKKFSYVSDSLLKSLKANKKEMIGKEVTNLIELVKQL